MENNIRTEKIIQLKIDSEIKERTDFLFNKYGISTQMAVRLFIYWVVEKNNSPFNDLFS